VTRAGVPVTAIGTLCAFGAGLDALVAGLASGACPVRPATGIGYPERPEPEMNGFPTGTPPPGDQACADRLLEVVDRMLGEWTGTVDLLRGPDTALVVGTGGFLPASALELMWRRQHPDPHDTPFRIRGPHWGASLIVDHLRLTGPVLTLTTGCSSSANALLVASRMLQRGQVRRAIVIGAEEVSAVTLSGFASLMLLDPLGCRPFDRDRAGLRLGEAMAALMLERDAAGPVRIAGGANRCDTHHLTSAGPDGSVMRAVMLEALAAADVAPADVVAVKAHGTGSIDSDRAEAHALRTVFGKALPPVCALKGQLGHTLGACGAIEVAALAGCHRAGFLPRSVGFRDADPELGLEPTRTPQAAREGPHLLDFFGFGGNYTSLVLDLGASR